MNLVLKLFTIFICLAQSDGKARDVEDSGKKYLLQYGYLDTFSTGKEGLKVGLIRFQYFANLPQTGKLDSSTLKQMTLPRCGLQDPKVTLNKRKRRYLHQGTRWKKNLLTWRLEGRGRTLDRETVRKVMYKAMRLWTVHTNINFKEISGNNPDVWVKFVSRYHGDPYSFDGQGGTLAHAFYPLNNKGLSGDVHFDDEENYTYKSSRGRNLLWVATHELGHTLGMEHSNVQNAVMYPWYTKYKPGFKLTSDDILGIQYLYGSRVEKDTTAPTTRSTTTTRPTTPVTRPIPRNRPCPSSSIAAIYYNSYARLQVVLTKANKMCFVNKRGIKYGPVQITNYFPRMKSGIDAAYMTKQFNNRDRTILFSGSRYYIYQHFRLESGPHSIHGNVPGDKNPLQLKFPTWVKKIDAAMRWHRNKRVYIFAGDYYWRYNQNTKRFDRGYPRRTVYAWKGSPKKIDAAYSSDVEKKTYFVSGNQFYKLDDYYVRVKTGYPEHIGREWLNCGGRKSLGGLSVGSIILGGVTIRRGRDP